MKFSTTLRDFIEGRDWLRTFAFLGVFLIALTLAVGITFAAGWALIAAFGGDLVALIFVPLGLGCAIFAWCGVVMAAYETYDS